MTPDHRPDIVRTEPAADEISLCSVIRVEKQGRLWMAVIGPDGAVGLRAYGHTPRQAVAFLMVRCEALGWVWDETWREPRVS